MSSIRIHEVCKQFGAQVVLDGVSLDLHPGQIVGLVGANGAGKTTLFRLIAGLDKPDTGAVTFSSDLQIGYLPQEPQINPHNTLHDEVASAFDELLKLEHRLHDLSQQMAEGHQGSELDELMRRYDRINARFVAAGGYTFEQRLNEILGGLGFSNADGDLPVSVLSGGQKCRASLAKLLLQDSHFLLLDEPTNHLDIDAVRWLEKFLAGHRGGAVIISHDRYLLDRLADRIVELEGAGVCEYPGDYSTYVKTKQLRRLAQARQYKKDKAFIEKERAFIAKHLAGQRTKEAQGRRARLERSTKQGQFVLDKPAEQRRAKLQLDSNAATDVEVLRAEGLSKRYDEKVLFDDLHFQVQAGQRFGITGPNGTGKSTLIKIIVGQLEADRGQVTLGGRTGIGYYAQEATGLDPNATVLEEVCSLRKEMRPDDARSYLARFQFTGDDVFKTVSKLSGGEQSRLRLVKLILSSHNLLLLDEPTNHLDISSREALEESLAGYAGTIIMVSHDRYLLDRIADRLMVMRPQGTEIYAGNYSFYVEQIEHQQAREKQAAKSTTGKTIRPSRTDKPPASKPAREDAKYDTYSIEQLEEVVIARENELAELNARFAEPDLYKDKDSLRRLREQIDTVKRELQIAEDAWAERLEYQ